MEIDTGYICRLCLKICHNFETIDETHREALNILLLTLNLEVSDEPVICKICARKLQKCSTFKTLSLYTKNEMKELNNKRNSIEYMCLFCKKLSMFGSSIFLNSEELDILLLRAMLDQYFPELDPLTVRQSVICTACYKCLQSNFEFIVDCLSVEEHIRKYCQVVGYNNQCQIKLVDAVSLDIEHKGCCSSSNVKSEENWSSENGKNDNCYNIKKEDGVEKNIHETRLEDGSHEANIGEKHCVEDKSTKTKRRKSWSNWIEIGNNSSVAVSNMNVKEEKICRLCLTVAENDFQIIDESTRNILEVLLIKLNLDISKDPIICRDCAEVAKKCFDFKSAYIGTEQTSTSFAIRKSRSIFKSKNLYREEDKRTVKFMCCFCSNYSTDSNFVLLDTLMNNVTFATMLKTFMSEMDFNIIKNPLICPSCKQDLECYIKFVENSLAVEEKITKYIEKEGTPSSVQVKLSDILHSLFTNTFELDYSQMHAIKQEDAGQALPEECDSDLIKAEEVNIKDEESNFTTLEFPSDMPMYKLNMPCSLKAEITKTDQKLCTKNIEEAHILNCEKCTYGTNRKNDLKKHMLIHKDITEVEMYNCIMCTYGTKRKNDLKTHMLIHKDITKGEMYNCTMCTYETKRKNYLKIHMLSHKDITEVEMCKCSMCTFETKYKGVLKKHMLIHNEVKEVKMYNCSMCAYETIDKSNLRRHVLIHKDIINVKLYKCLMCAYETKDKSNLRRHVLIHKDITEVELYKCSMCIYKTRRKGNLKTHMFLTHKDQTEVEVYKCSICNFQTIQKSKLKTHILIHRHYGDGNI